MQYMYSYKKTNIAKKPLTKALTKADLVQDLKVIRKLNDALEEENQKKLDILDDFKMVKQLNDALCEEVKDDDNCN